MTENRIFKVGEKTLQAVSPGGLFCSSTGNFVSIEQNTPRDLSAAERNPAWQDPFLRSADQNALRRPPPEVFSRQETYRFGDRARQTDACIREAFPAVGREQDI